MTRPACERGEQKCACGGPGRWGMSRYNRLYCDRREANANALRHGAGALQHTLPTAPCDMVQKRCDTRGMNSISRYNFCIVRGGGGGGSGLCVTTRQQRAQDSAAARQAPVGTRPVSAATQPTTWSSVSCDTVLYARPGRTVRVAWVQGVHLVHLTKF